jgi:hypothetical protein
LACEADGEGSSPLYHPNFRKVIMTEKQKFEQWYQKEKANGLLDVKFSFGDMTGATVESVFGEINRMIASPELEDLDLI